MSLVTITVNLSPEAWQGLAVVVSLVAVAVLVSSRPPRGTDR
jgi:hypothetical protein